MDKNPTTQSSVPLKEETISVIIVNGTYFPGQKLRFKLNDPSYNFCKILNTIFLENLWWRFIIYFSIIPQPFKIIIKAKFN